MAEQQASSSRTTKPPRLHSACTSCHHAKLRCSGEKSGCSRCIKLSFACEYTISLVGRAPKRRRLGNQENQESNIMIRQVSDTINRHTVLTYPSNVNPPDLYFPGWTNQDLFGITGDHFPQDDLFNLSTEQFSVHNFLPGGSSSSTSQFSIPLSDQDTWYTNSAYDLDHNASVGLVADNINITQHSLVNQPPDLNQLPNPEESSAARSHHGQQHTLSALDAGSKNMHWPHIQALSRSIAYLDTHVSTESIAIDEAMRVSKICIDDVTKIMSLDTYRWCRSCKTLISTIVDLIVTLYEIASGSLEGASAVNDHLSLHFGVFEIGPEVHLDISRHIIRTELLRIPPIVRTLGLGCRAEMGSDSQARHQQQFSEMEKRVQDLISSLSL